MAKWEVCNVEYEVRWKKRFLGGDVQMIKSIAVLQNLGGKKIIDETPEFDNYFSDYGGEKLSNERSKLIARLLADGWEPLSTDQWGNVNSFRREVP